MGIQHAISNMNQLHQDWPPYLDWLEEYSNDFHSGSTSTVYQNNDMS